MPWIEQSMCTGCGICIEECPVDVIIMEDDKASINNDECIRCAICHNICPVDAVKHDGDREEEMFENNIEKAKADMEACAKYLDEADRWKSLDRAIRHFKREERIAKRTLNELEKIKRSKEKN